MARIGQLIVTLTAQTEQFTRQMSAAQRRNDQLARSFQRLALVAVGALGGRQLLRGAQNVLHAFERQQDAVESLRAALQVTGKNGSEDLARLTARAAELQRVTRQGDEAIISATASMAQLATELSAAELAQAQEALIGIADTFTRGDVESAALLLGKSIGSTTNALTRYGIQVDTGATQSQKLAQILRQSQGFFAVSQARAQTLAGRTAQLSNAWGDFKEQIGRVLSERTALPAFIESLTRVITDMVTVLSGSGEQIRQGFEILGKIAANAFSAALLTTLDLLIPDVLSNAISNMAALPGPLGTIGNVAQSSSWRRPGP